MDLWGIAYLLLIGVLLPGAAWRSVQRLEAGARFPERSGLYLVTLLQQLVMVAMAWWVARTNDMPLFPDPALRGRDALLALALLAVLGAALPIRWRSMSTLDRARFLPLLPRTSDEKLLFTPLAVLAGIGEEIVYRGTLFELLRRATGSTWIAAIAAATSFGGAHAVQGFASAVVVGLIGLALQGLAAATGALYAGMVVHVVVDLGVGLFARRILGGSSEPIDWIDRRPDGG